MPGTLRCPHCGANLKYSTPTAPARARCPECTSLFAVGLKCDSAAAFANHLRSESAGANASQRAHPSCEPAASWPFCFFPGVGETKPSRNSARYSWSRAAAWLLIGATVLLSSMIVLLLSKGQARAGIGAVAGMFFWYVGQLAAKRRRNPWVFGGLAFILSLLFFVMGGLAGVLVIYCYPKREALQNQPEVATREWKSHLAATAIILGCVILGALAAAFILSPHDNARLEVDTVAEVLALAPPGRVHPETPSSITTIADAPNMLLTDWQKISIPGVCTFQIPPTLEVQKGAYKVLSDIIGGIFLEVTGATDRVVVQPRGGVHPEN